MGVDCGFDIYPPLEPTPDNQAKYELFLREVLEEYGLRHDGESNPSVSGDGNNVVRVNSESERSYIEFMVGEHPRITRHCQNFLRFSSKISGRSQAEPYIRHVCKIARKQLGDRVYFWHEDSDGLPLFRSGCYNWKEIYAARKRIEEPSPAKEKPKEPEQSEMLQDEPLRGGSGSDEPTNVPVNCEKKYDIQSIPGRGQGLIATSKISRGTRILTEAPLFRLPDSVSDVQAAERAVLREVRGLSRHQQRAFFGLQNVHGRKYTPLLGIAKTNMLPLAGKHDGDGGLFLEASRLNHSCRPNTQHTWNSDLDRLTVHALYDIEAGHEITISYFSSISMCYAERQRYLVKAFSFSCACELCSLPPSARLLSDRRLTQILSLEQKAGRVDSDDVYRHATQLFRQARRRLELMGEEDIRDIRLPKAYLFAFRIAIMVADKARAKVFAERAYTARKLFSGDDNPMTIVLKRLAERPLEHPEYDTAMNCFADSWEPPQDIGGEEFEKWLWNTDGWSWKVHEKSSEGGFVFSAHD